MARRSKANPQETSTLEEAIVTFTSTTPTPTWLKEAQAKSAIAPTPTPTKGKHTMSDNQTFASAAELGLEAASLNEVRLPLDQLYDVWIDSVELSAGKFGPQARIRTRFDENQRGNAALGEMTNIVRSMFTYIDINGGPYQRFCSTFGIADAFNHRWDGLSTNPMPATVRIKEQVRTIEVENPDGEKTTEQRVAYQVAPGCWFVKR